MSYIDCPPPPVQTRSDCGIDWYDHQGLQVDAYSLDQSIAIISRWSREEYRFTMLQFKPVGLSARGMTATLEEAKAEVEKRFMAFLFQAGLQVVA